MGDGIAGAKTRQSGGCRTGQQDGADRLGFDDERDQLQDRDELTNASRVFHQALYGRIQRGEFVHLVAHRLTDLSAWLGSVGERDDVFPLPHGRGDEFHHGSPAPDPRGLPKGPRPRDIVDPYLHLNAIRVKPRDFR